jgi:tetratricopeptide (TPR) repeat protein
VPGPTAERSQDQWRRDLSAAARILRWAIRLAGEGNDQAAASHFERGVVLEHKEDYGEAAREFKTAAQIHLANCEYPARRARALARHWSVSGDPQFREDACEEAAHALRMLARTFSLAVAPFAASAIDLRCNATLKALADTYRILGADPDTERIRGIKELKETLQAWGGRDSVDPKAGARQLAELRKHEARRPRGGRADPDWELEQIEVALGRLQSKARDWRGARGTFEGLIGRLRGTHPERLVEFSAYANYARALRECGYYAEALRAAAEGVRRDPLNVEGRREAGRAHFALGQFGDALASWEHAMWLSPSDPYLHYEVGMCHRRMAGSAPDAAQRDQRLAVAASHFASAEELFDGEDLTGQAWTRLWQGRIALERGRTAEAIAHLEAGSHSSARPAGLLLLGEARLELGARSVAEHAFEACEKALGKGSARRSPKQTLDPGWGDELPLAAVRARVKRGLAEAVHLAPGDWQNETELTKARDDIKAAKDELQTLEPAARDEALTMCLDTEAKILHALGEIEEALELIRERLRYGAPRHALVQEAELLSLLAAGNRRIDERSRVRIAARHARETVARNGSIA